MDRSGAVSLCAARYTAWSRSLNSLACSPYKDRGCPGIANI